jgi:hypothetical protein
MSSQQPQPGRHVPAGRIIMPAQEAASAGRKRVRLRPTAGGGVVRGFFARSPVSAAATGTASQRQCLCARDGRASSGEYSR